MERELVNWSTRHVFPTRVGMNCGITTVEALMKGVPHARGDEPDT